MRQWRKWTIATTGSIGLLYVVGRIYLYLRPQITPPSCAFLLDTRIRRLYRDPVHTLAPLGLQDGQRVLEIGGGTGTFTGTAAAQLAPHGQLISLELQRGMLQLLQHRMQSTDLTNLLISQATAMALPLPDASIDVVYLIAVLPMVPNQQQVLHEIWRVLRPDGLLAVSEELLAPEYVPATITRRWGRRAGFTVVATQRGFWSYMVLFRRGATQP